MMKATLTVMDAGFHLIIHYLFLFGSVAVGAPGARWQTRHRAKFSIFLGRFRVQTVHY